MNSSFSLRRLSDDSPEEPRMVCRMCGCTDDDCSQCIAKTGKPCSWAEPGLCSACTESWDRSEHRRATANLHQIYERQHDIADISSPNIYGEVQPPSHRREWYSLWMDWGLHWKYGDVVIGRDDSQYSVQHVLMPLSRMPDKWMKIPYGSMPIPSQFHRVKLKRELRGRRMGRVTSEWGTRFAATDGEKGDGTVVIWFTNRAEFKLAHRLARSMRNSNRALVSADIILALREGKLPAAFSTRWGLVSGIYACFSQLSPTEIRDLQLTEKNAQQKAA